MYGLEKVADWWDRQFEQSERIMQDWVNGSESEYGLHGRAAVAALGHTSMVLGSGLVDLLRIGEGIKEGGGWGYARDGLRVLSLAGPVLKLGRLGAAKWTYNPTGGWCASVATAKALKHTGTRLFVKVSDIIEGTGKKAPKNLNQFLPLLRSLGARCKEVPLATVQNLNVLLKANQKSVILFGVKWTMPNKGPVGHALFAFRDSLGRLKIADRTGRVVKSLEELENFYPGISNSVPQGAAVLIHNAIKVEGTGLLSMLGLEVNAILSRSKLGKEVIVVPVNTD